ncbi:MAG: carboxymuconolactone decarboxylase family protein, partial [Chloroflexi bacterium]|nr:carboxymuconolactone decarboxylase family protein [Chloroflexota bacterium]
MTVFAPKPRLKNSIMIAPGAIQALQAFTAAVDDLGLPRQVIDLVHLRAS